MIASRRIKIYWSLDLDIDWNCALSEIQLRELCVFNHKEFHLLAGTQNWERHALILYVYNPEFSKVKSGEECPSYSYTEARKKFPYLFAETNPILYRKFI